MPWYKSTAHTGVMGIYHPWKLVLDRYHPWEISRRQSSRLISHGWYTPITPVRAVDSSVYLCAVSLSTYLFVCCLTPNLSLRFSSGVRRELRNDSMRPAIAIWWRKLREGPCTTCVEYLVQSIGSLCLLYGSLSTLHFQCCWLTPATTGEGCLVV